MLPTIKISIERWRWNKYYGLWVSTHGHFRDKQKKEVIPHTTDGGYLVVKVTHAAMKYEYAHRVVAFTWLPMGSKENGTVDHIDQNKRNNWVSNLEWVTQKENVLRGAKNSLVYAQKHEELDSVFNLSIITEERTCTVKELITQIQKERSWGGIESTKDMLNQLKAIIKKPAHSLAPDGKSHRFFGHNIQIEGLNYN